MELTEKTRYFIKLAVVTVIVYFSFKYLLPLFLPFLAAYLIAHILKPAVIYLNSKLRVNKRIITIILIGLMVCVLGGAVSFIISTASSQVRKLITNYDKYEEKVNNITDKTCCMAEKYSGVDSEEIKGYLNKGIDRLFSAGKSSDIMYTVMNKSIDTIIMLGEILVLVLTAIFSAYFMIMDNKNDKKSGSKLTCELKKISGRVGKVCTAYVKTQLVIMVITTIVCFTSFMIIRNNYALVFALVAGFLDALPLFGIGIILIPWGIIYIITGNYFKAAVLLVTFLICYMVREFVEPKIMGHQIGISPLMTIMSICIWDIKCLGW